MCIDGGREMTKAMRDARKKRGITQKEIAELIGVKPDYIRRVEKNKVKTPAYVVYRYCQILRVPPEVFFKTDIKENDAARWITDALPHLPDYLLKGIQNLIYQYINEQAEKRSKK